MSQALKLFNMFSMFGCSAKRGVKMATESSKITQESTNNHPERSEGAPRGPQDRPPRPQ